MKSAWWKTALKYGIGFAVLAYVVWSNWDGKNGQPGLNDALNRPIQLPFAVVAAILLGTNTLLTIVRWFVLVRALELPFTLKSALRLGLVGYFFNTFLPGSVGGDLLKATFIAREQERRTAAVATVLLDRAIGLWALIVLVAISGGIFWLLDDPAVRDQPYLRQVTRFALWLFAGSVAAWALLGVLPVRRAQRFAMRLTLVPKIGHSFAEFWLAVWLYRSKPRTILTALLMSLVGHTCSVFMFFFVVRAFQPAGVSADMPTLSAHFLLVPVGMVVQAFFPAPGGVGGGELIFGWLYEILGHPQSTGILGSLGQRMLSWGLAAVGYVVYLSMKSDLLIVTTDLTPDACPD